MPAAQQASMEPLLRGLTIGVDGGQWRLLVLLILVYLKETYPPTTQKAYLSRLCSSEYTIRHVLNSTL